MKKNLQNKNGSVVLSVVIITLIVSTLMGSYLSLSVSEHRAAQRNLLFQGAMNLAEAAAEEAFRAINHNDFQGWTSSQHGDALRLSEQFRQGEQHILSAVIFSAGSNPALIAEGRIRRGNVEVSRQVRIAFEEALPASFFVEGFVAKDKIRFIGNAEVGVDSYNSRFGPYLENVTNDENEIVVNRFANGSVGSTSVENDDVEINHAKIWGYSLTNGTEPKIGNHGEVRGPDTPSDVKVDEDRMVKDFYAEFVDVPHPSPTGALTSWHGSGTNLYFGNPDHPVDSQTVYHMDSLRLEGQQVLKIYNDVTLVIDKDPGSNLDYAGLLRITGQASIELAPGAKLTIYSNGDLQLGGNGIVNPGDPDASPPQHPRPGDLLVYGTAKEGEGQEIALGGNAAMHSAIYAPNADVSLGGGGHAGAFYGAIVGQSISISGNYQFHFDESLREMDDDNAPRRPRMLSWREVTEPTHRFDFGMIF